MDDTNPHEVDVIERLSELAEGLTEAQVDEEYEVLKPALLHLYLTDRAKFALAAGLVKKKFGIPRKDIETALKQLRGTSDHGSAQATQLVALAENVEFFHTPDGEPWATIPVKEHYEHWPVKARGFRRWLRREFYVNEKKAPGSQAIQDALGVFEGKALHEGPECPVFTRVAEHKGTIYIDLANEEWDALAISPQEWKVVASPPVRFQRTKGMLPLPRPVTGGSLDELRPFVNVEEEDWVLLLAWLLMCHSPKGPYPVMGLGGEQGSTKSTTARVLRSLIDPFSAPLRATPRDERDLMISANAGWTLAFDNLSLLPTWLSDAFCRLATGGGFSTRQLYSDDEEMIFDAQRPILFTAIKDIALASDLVDRGIRLLLPKLPDEKRRPEAEFWQAFETAARVFLGHCLMSW